MSQGTVATVATVDKNTEFQQPLECARLLLFDSLSGVSPLVDIVYAYLPRYQCTIQFSDCPSDPLYVHHLCFRDSNVLYLHIGAKELNGTDTTKEWSAIVLKENRNLLALLEYPVPKPFPCGFGGASLVVTEESNEFLCRRWQDLDLEDEYLEQERALQDWRHWIPDIARVQMACNRPIGSVNHASFHFQDSFETDKSTLSFLTSADIQNYQIHLVQGELLVRIPESTLIPPPPATPPLSPNPAPIAS